ncbi:MAG TPA: hypothetical protein VH877_05395 [Polyangia bacterium]|jgi:hypothetical protein|nr:hypothetical protein [Polyangia bacterium]
MPARKLDRSGSASELRREIVWSHSACEGDPIALALAPRFAQLLVDLHPLYLNTVQYEDALLRAEQALSSINDRIDDHIDAVHLAVLTVAGEDRSDPHYTIYFQDAPSILKRLALDPKREMIRELTLTLQREQDPRLKPFLAMFTQDVTDAEAARIANLEAEKALRHSREVGEFAQFYDRVEQVRDDVYGFLDQYRAQHPELGLPRNYVGRFFLKAPPRKLTEEQRQAKAEAKAKARAEKAAKEAARKAAQDKFRQARHELAQFKR